jgi:hypothetical protein
LHRSAAIIRMPTDLETLQVALLRPSVSPNRKAACFKREPPARRSLRASNASSGVEVIREICTPSRWRKLCSATSYQSHAPLFHETSASRKASACRYHASLLSLASRLADCQRHQRRSRAALKLSAEWNAGAPAMINRATSKACRGHSTAGAPRLERAQNTACKSAQSSRVCAPGGSQPLECSHQPSVESRLKRLQHGCADGWGGYSPSRCKAAAGSDVRDARGVCTKVYKGGKGVLLQKAPTFATKLWGENTCTANAAPE